MAKERKPQNYDVTDSPAWRIENNVRNKASVLMGWKDVDMLSLGLPGTLPINDKLYPIVVRLIEENGLQWLRDVMEESGKPIPPEIYSRLLSAEANCHNYSTKDFPNVFSEDPDIDIGYRFMLPNAEYKMGIVLLELLRDNYPTYFTEVMRVIYNILSNMAIKINRGKISEEQ